ncbi:TetR/AcrR family transcriptional regulator [Paenibacillus sp. HB172176]|uniref:TetR/AcrR family transcriptional regulator n=1 Tax=Paenibacillus sp. HB172176 TaxID=2493690 RepID=UPI00143C0835|nr:TetR/AcrR family transcriptional regulator [Paenibacillus sp. HB172176]
MPYEQEASTRNNILNVTIEVIKNEGFEEVTIRKIAALADVNVALVNYHFGSKEKLLNEVVQSILDSFRDCFHIFERLDLTPKHRLAQFFTDYMTVFKQYPQLLRRLIAANRKHKFDTQYDYISFIKSTGIELVLNAIKEITSETDTQQVYSIMTQIMGAILFPLLMAPSVMQLSGFREPDIASHVESVLDVYFRD